MTFASVFETALGTGVIVASEEGICRVHLPYAGYDAVAAVQSLGDVHASDVTEQAADMLKHYFKGAPQPFEVLPVDLRSLTAFRQRILELIRAVPFGEVRSYGEVALLAGVPAAARAIGGAMAANPVPVIIPCHRVVAANGALTGYTAPGGLGMKNYLLHLERIEFKGQKICMQ